MAPVTFTPPKQWEDWLSWILGFWLCISPWALIYANDPIATRNAVVVGFLVILTEVITLSIFEPWEELINVALGAWLVVCPWLLGAMHPVARVNFVVVGVVVVALATYEMRQADSTGST